MLDIFMVLTAGMYGLGGACTVRVGAELGSGQPATAKIVAKLTFCCMCVCGISIGAMFVLLADVIGSLFSKDEEVQHIAAELSYLVGALYILLSFLYASFSGAVLSFFAQMARAAH